MKPQKSNKNFDDHEQESKMVPTESQELHAEFEAAKARLL
jgi:hypothetical protein